MRYVITQRFAFQLTVCSEKARKNTHGNNPTFRKFCPSLQPSAGGASRHPGIGIPAVRALPNRQGAKAAKAIRQCTPMAANGFSIESNESLESMDSNDSIRSIHSTALSVPPSPSVPTPGRREGRASARPHAVAAAQARGTAPRRVGRAVPVTPLRGVTGEPRADEPPGRQEREEVRLKPFRAAAGLSAGLTSLTGLTSPTSQTSRQAGTFGGQRYRR